ncbi:uncharacterized protein LOC110460221 [Mizuhopecten yessoensis]|uniref:uncharacterized protein LOC110460221 n=1 Tax=Mizuhopecten yessoensis TaxID=6573 RepID=UPI000B45CCE4|nr:uncharacterized protein LOC110460221 [Mizuhopecten yessoensis]
MLWISVLVVVISTAVAQDFNPNRNYGAGTSPSRDRLYGSQRRVLDTTFQGTSVPNGHSTHVRDRQYHDQVDTGYGQSRSKKVLHKPVVDTGYIGQKQVHREYVKPALNGHLDSGYVKPKIASPLDTGYVQPKLVDPLDPASFLLKVTSPLGKEYVKPKIPGAGDLGYVDPSLLGGLIPHDPFDTGYIKPKIAGPLDPGYVKPKIAGPLDHGYVKPKLVDPLDLGYVKPKLVDPLDSAYVLPKVTSPLGKDYVEPKILGPGDVGYVDPRALSGPMAGELIDPMVGHGQVHPTPPVGPFYGERANIPGVSTSDFVAVETENIDPLVRRNDLIDPSWNGSPRNSLDQSFPEQRRLPSTIHSERLTRQRNMEDAALTARRNDFRDPSWNGSPRNHLDQVFPEQNRLPSTIHSERLTRQRNMEDAALTARRNDFRDPSWNGSPRTPLDQGFPEQNRLPSTIQSERSTRQRNNVPFDQGFSQSRQRMLPLSSKPIPPPLTKKTVTTKNIRKTAEEKRSYYKSLRQFRG